MVKEKPQRSFLSQARQEYASMARTATLRRLWASLTGQNNDLIPFEDLRQILDTNNQRYRGLQAVPLDKIIGSLNRSQDFDRYFLPTQTHSRSKWVSVDSAYLGGVTLPAISLYKVGDAYFVVDGHHRVSVARQAGQSFIDAEVIEVESRVPVTADLTLDDLDRVAAYRRFLEETKLDELRPGQDLTLTMPGDYARLLDHIHVHKYLVEKDEKRDLTWEEAIKHWYDRVYLPVKETIERKNLLTDFPGHTQADLYLWIIEHAYYLAQQTGQTLAPSEVARDFVNRFGRRPNRLWARIRRWFTGLLVPDELESGPPAGTWREERIEPAPAEHLFRDILVTVTGAETGWLALSQAAEIARLEGSTVRGLHVTSSSGEEDDAHTRQVLDEFTFRCQSLGVASSISVAHGDVAEQIIERARWVDLVVINQRRVHGQWAERPLGTIFQTVAERAARPILAVPGSTVLPLHRILLAYDGSPKSREALFIFKHMVQCWDVEGIILTVSEDASAHELLDQAWQYAQTANTNVSTRLEHGSPTEVITRVMGEAQADLLLMGGFGYQPLLKAFLGSTVARVLRVAWFPVLICR